MIKRPFAVVFSAFCTFSMAQAGDRQAPERLFVWDRMDWTFASDAARAAFEEARVWARAPLAGVEADAQGNVYVSTPRWIDRAVPSTLSRVIERDGRFLLEPFPSREAHDLSDPNAIRNALGAFVDSRQRMWIVDMGWVAGESGAPEGAQKLIGIDLTTGREIARVPLDDVAPRDTSFLNDLVVDERRGLIVITDSGNRGGAPVPSGLIVYDIDTGATRRILDRHPALQDDPDLWLKVDGREVFPGNRLAVGVNGITLSGDGARLWFSLTTGDAIRSVPMDLVADPTVPPDILAEAVSDPIRIGGGSDGIATDSSGRIWITNLALNRIEVLNPGETRTRILSEGSDFVWPDSLARDFAGGMLLSVNRLDSAFGATMTFEQGAENFAVWRFPEDMTPTR
ncbi:MAG: L-dopachrome tautomerase-related protein [Pseudomonadota bacterium]